MKTHQNKVKAFFDDIAPEYHQKFSPKNPFLSYYFSERLKLACVNHNFQNKTVLDIGAGTGSLYEYLSQYHSNFDYWASDISTSMLEQSDIPNERQLVGNISDLSKDLPHFDFIFLLGVSSYMDENSFFEHLNFIQSKLKPNGKAIISFTNQQSMPQATK